MHALSRKQFLETCGSVVAMALAGSRCAAPLPPTTNRQAQAGSPGSPLAAPAIRADFIPGYLHLHRSGELARRGEALWRAQERCHLCPRQCGAARLNGERGFCGASSSVEVASFHQHFGEEAPLVGRGGSGTIFVRHCSLRCVFCINWSTNQGAPGGPSTVSQLADMMLALQNAGCHNINLVTPTHYSPQLVLALDEAARRGLRLPLVYNTSGWERLEILEQLDGMVDIYLPDIKYSEGQMADRYSSGARDYPEVARRAVLEMHRQVGVARPDSDGLMYRGLMIRHLVMPSGVGGTREVIAWIAANLPKDTYVNLMSQYRPAFKARAFPAIARPLTREEWGDAVAWARRSGLTRVDLQGGRWM
jgi:putative pyruvate formate lyase activating enzyme